MSMEITNNYSNYVANDVSNASQTASSEKVSKSTQEYLNELKQKYPNVNITVVDFKSDKQKLSYMMGSSGLQNLAISGNVLEKMANDSATAAKYESLIAKMPDDAKETQKFADEHNSIIYGSGMVIDRNGKVTYWAVGGDKVERRNLGNEYRDKVQAELKEKRAEKKKQDAIDKRKADAKKQAEALQEKRIAAAETKEKMLEKMSENKNNSVSDDSAVIAKAVEEGKGTQVDLSI